MDDGRRVLEVSSGLDICIAGERTGADWRAARENLLVGKNHENWRQAFANFFEARLKLRYLEPISILQDYAAYQGEGFSIAAIQCTLIEFLESTVQGKNHRYCRRKSELGPHEYKDSRDIFVSFLTKRAPFSVSFNIKSAGDFYSGVRCGLLHEARTKNGWRIKAYDPTGSICDIEQLILYRNNFQDALMQYIHTYGEQLPYDSKLQEAFLRKFDDLCAS